MIYDVIYPIAFEQAAFSEIFSLFKYLNILAVYPHISELMLQRGWNYVAPKIPWLQII